MLAPAFHRPTLIAAADHERARSWSCSWCWGARRPGSCWRSACSRSSRTARRCSGSRSARCSTRSPPPRTSSAQPSTASRSPGWRRAVRRCCCSSRSSAGGWRATPSARCRTSPSDREAGIGSVATVLGARSTVIGSAALYLAGRRARGALRLAHRARGPARDPVPRDGAALRDDHGRDRRAREPRVAAVPRHQLRRGLRRHPAGDRRLRVREPDGRRLLPCGRSGCSGSSRDPARSRSGTTRGRRRSRRRASGSGSSWAASSCSTPPTRSACSRPAIRPCTTSRRRRSSCRCTTPAG